jgi:hypothetical protein
MAGAAGVQPLWNSPDSFIRRMRALRVRPCGTSAGTGAGAGGPGL